MLSVISNTKKQKKIKNQKKTNKYPCTKNHTTKKTKNKKNKKILVILPEAILDKRDDFHCQFWSIFYLILDYICQNNHASYFCDNF